MDWAITLLADMARISTLAPGHHSRITVFFVHLQHGCELDSGAIQWPARRTGGSATDRRHPARYFATPTTSGYSQNSETGMAKIEILPAKGYRLSDLVFYSTTGANPGTAALGIVIGLDGSHTIR